MNNPNTYQTPNIDTSWEQLRQTVQDQAELIRSLQAQSKKCECHVIDPAKMRILLWINRHKDGKPDTCVLKIAEQRLLGLPRSDRRGETYWRFDEIMEVKEASNPEPQTIKCGDCQKELPSNESSSDNELPSNGSSFDKQQVAKNKAVWEKALAKMKAREFDKQQKEAQENQPVQQAPETNEVKTNGTNQNNSSPRTE